MVRRKKFWFLVILILLWVGFIFARSLQPPDVSNLESQWVLDLLQMILPFGPSMLFVRKAAHFSEYAILGAFSGLLFARRHRCLLRNFLLALAVCLLIAACDELIQFFLSGRDGKPQDVCLDIAGSAIGILVILAVRSPYFRHQKKM